MTNNDSEKAEVLGKFFSSVYTIEPKWTWVLNDEDKPNISKVINIEITQELIQKKTLQIECKQVSSTRQLTPESCQRIS